MVNLQSLSVAFAPETTKKTSKSRFFKINSDFFINPDQIALIVPGKKSNTTFLLSNDNRRMATIIDSNPEEVVKVFDVLA